MSLSTDYLLIYMFAVYMPLCVGYLTCFDACTNMYVCRDWKLMSGASFYCISFHFTFFEILSVTEPVFTNCEWLRVAGQWALEIYLSLLLQPWACPTWSKLYVHVQDESLGFHACIPGTLPTEPSPQTL